MEKVHVILSRGRTVRIGGRDGKVSPMDSETLSTGEVRKIVNEDNDVATMSVTMPSPGKP